MRKFITQYRELISYVFWGAMTTLVNFTVYFACTRLLTTDPLVGNTAAWAVSVSFAFVSNKLLVFSSRSWRWATVLREAGQFVTVRLFSGVTETLLLFIFVRCLKLNDGSVKIIAGIYVVLLNYIMSKRVVFRKGAAAYSQRV